MIVETNHINRFAFEQVIIGGRLVTSRRDRTSSVITTYDLGEVIGKQGIDAYLTILRQRRGIMSGIQDQVCLL